MTHRQIEVGMCLRLKRSRMNDYSMDPPYVRVSSIKPHPGHKVPWIISGTDAFKPSDFEREVNDPRNELNPSFVLQRLSPKSHGDSKLIISATSESEEN